MLDDQCRLPCVTTASGRAEVDTWSLIHGGCYHVTQVRGPYGLWDFRWRLSFKITRSLWNYSRYSVPALAWMNHEKQHKVNTDGNQEWYLISGTKFEHGNFKGICWAIQGSNTGEGKIPFCPLKHPDRLLGPPNIVNGYRRSFRGVKRRGSKIYPFTSTLLRMGRIIPLLPLHIRLNGLEQRQIYLSLFTFEHEARIPPTQPRRAVYTLRKSIIFLWTHHPFLVIYCTEREATATVF
jgi:hypothetical protein